MDPLQPPGGPPSPVLLPIPIAIAPLPRHRLRKIPPAPLPPPPLIQRLQIIPIRIEPQPMLFFHLVGLLQREALLSVLHRRPSVIAAVACTLLLQLQFLVGVGADAGPEAGAEEEGAVEEGPAGEEAGGEEVDARLDAGPEGELDGRPGAVVEGCGAEEFGEADDGGGEAAVFPLLVWQKGEGGGVWLDTYMLPMIKVTVRPIFTLGGSWRPQMTG